MFTWEFMTNEAALEIVEWEYPDEFSFYNIQNDMDDLDEFLNPFKWNHYAAVYENEKLVGYFTFDPLNLEEVEIGLGLHPDLIGRGKGKAFTAYAMELADKWYEPKKLIVNVAKFNARAIKVYEKNGFKKTVEFLQETNGDEYSFIRMEKELSS
ncbi:GNAT family N-acetyltransferase [Salipaludibacillus keqinensis]|nr:GNAT family N-acetyltransferase [Salipaludibacillus keqinensis]